MSPGAARTRRLHIGPGESAGTPAGAPEGTGGVRGNPTSPEA